MTSGTFSECLSRLPAVRYLLKFPVVQRTLVPVRGDKSIHRFIRYSMVSAIAVTIAEVVILVCTWAFGLSGIAANTIACIVGTPVSFELNRKWAWGKSGKSHLWRQVVPFWALTLGGFLASTGTTQWADSMTRVHDVTGLLRSLAIMGSSLFAWGAIWIVKFVIFNRLVFVSRRVDLGPQPAQVGSAPEPELGGPASIAGGDLPMAR